MLQASHRAVLVNNIYEPVLKAGLYNALVSTFSQLQEVSSAQPAVNFNSRLCLIPNFSIPPFLLLVLVGVDLSAPRTEGSGMAETPEAMRLSQRLVVISE